MTARWYILSKVLQQKFLLTCAIFASLLVVCAVLLFGHVVRNFMDQVVPSGNLMYGIFQMVFVAAMFAVGSFIRSFVVNTLADRVVVSLIMHLYDSLIHKSPSFFDHFHRGDVLNRISCDVMAIRSFIATTASYSARNVMMFLGAIVLMFLTSWRVSTALMLAIFVLSVMFGFGIKKIKSLAKNYSLYRDNVISHFKETMDAVFTIQACSCEVWALGKMRDVCSNFKHNGVTMHFGKSLMTSSVLMGIILSMIFTLLLGTSFVTQGAITSGEFSAFILYTIIATTSLLGLSELHNEITQFVNSSERIAEISLSTIGEVKFGSIEASNFDIIFEHVAFSYNESSKQIFNDISFNIPHGSKIAIVGLSGIGKSTIVDLILRFYDVKHGSIKIGRDCIKDIDLPSWRSKISIATRDCYVFSGTILDNITLGDCDVDFSSALVQELGLDHVNDMSINEESHNCGEYGNKMSTGEKQRVILARCLSKSKAEVFIFDEAIASLDKDNRSRAMNAIMKHTKNKTVIFITHHYEEFSDLFDDIIHIKAN